MEKIKQIDSFIRRTSLYHGEDMLNEYGGFFFLCGKSAYTYRGHEITTFVNKYINIKDFEYEKIEYYVAKCIYRLSLNPHVEIFYAVNIFRPIYGANGKCYPQRTSSSVSYCNTVFTDIDLPEEMRGLSNSEVLEMVKARYWEVFEVAPISFAVRSGGGLTFLL